MKLIALGRATGFLKAFQNAELPEYAVPCRRCLSEDVDFSRKVLKDRGKADTMSASADCRHGCRL